ncbi:MAG: outer membrane protein transport protein, partial [Desulfosarcina sp.]
MQSGTTEDLYGIWGSAANDLFAVGMAGTILHFDGTAWQAMASATTETLNEVSGTSGDDVYAVGDMGTILHYDGRAWSPMPVPTAETLDAVWVASPEAVFAGGAQGSLVFFDGQDWSTMASGTANHINDIWGRSATDAYAVTDADGEILHYDGRIWSAESIPGATILSSLWGLADGTLFVVGNLGGIYRRDGNDWQTLRPAGSRFRSVTDLALHRTNPDIVYASTYQAGVYLSPNQGGRWLNLGTPRLEVNAIAAGSLYAATSGGLYQLTGTGVLAGEVTDGRSRAMLDGIQVTSDLGLRCEAGQGQYMMVSPAGIFDIYATADQYDMAAAGDVTVVGGDVTWQDFEMQPANGLGGSAGGSLTVTSDSSGGGAYCFIATMDVVSKARWLWMAVILAAGLILMVGFGLGRWLAWLPLIVAAGIFGHGPSVEAFTLFQQVGVTSPPSPVGSGARAMGMGGTFIAIADDATAASWNPAGLVQLERPEVSIVGDYYWRTESYDSDRHPEVANTSHDDHGNLNYLSATLPFHWHRNMVVSVNYQRLYDFYQDLDFRRNLTQGPIQLDQQIHFDQSGTVGAIGLAGGVEITPRLSLGLTVNLWTDQLGYDNGWESNYNETADGLRAGVPVSVQTRIQDRYEEFRGINFNLGLLWETDGWGSLGAVVKTPFTATLQHHFRFDQTQTFGAPLDTTLENGPIRVDEEVELSMPWSYGLGWSKRFTDRFTAGVDIYRTEWSDYYLEDGQGNQFSPIDGRLRADSDVDATTHVRLGGEYLFLWPVRQLAVPLRLGLFYDPEPSEGNPEDVFGMALGSGISTSRFSIDLAYQLRWADDIDTGNVIATSSADMTRHTVLASLIYYF